MLLLALQAFVRAGRDVLRDGGRALLPGQGVQGHLGARVWVGDGGVRDLVLDAGSLAQLRARREAWEAERAAWIGAGETWPDHDLIFGDTDGQLLMPWQIDYHWRAMRDSCAVQGIRFHDLRHTYASLAIANGMDVRMLAERLGHADASVTLRVYAHIFKGQRRRAAVALDDLLLNAERAAESTTTRAHPGGQEWTPADEKAG